VVQDADPTALAATVQRLLADGGELVTVVAGRTLVGASVDRLREGLADAVAVRHPEVEVTVLAGGQDRPAAVVAVE
jgi:hypothetical protein